MKDDWPLNFEGIIDDHHLALPDHVHYSGWFWRTSNKYSNYFPEDSWFDLSQKGSCNNCKIKLASYAKNVICPKCHSKAYLT